MVSSFFSQMQNLGAQSNGMDPELLISRKKTRDAINQLLQRRNYDPNSEVMRRIPELAKFLEECIYRDAILQGKDYRNMTLTSIKQHVLGISRTLNSCQRPHHMPSSSALITPIVTPGIVNSGNKDTILSIRNTTISANNGDIMSQSPVNVGSLQPRSGAVDVGQIASNNAFTVPNEYQQSPAKMVHSYGRNSITYSISRTQQSNQMIPTPGLNTKLFLNSETFSVSGCSIRDVALVSPQQQQKQYIGQQNSNILLGSRGQLKSSRYKFSNEDVNGVISCLDRNNMQHANGPLTPEGYVGDASSGSLPNPLQQNFDKQHRQPLVWTSSSQQMLPLISDGHASGTFDRSKFGDMYGSLPSAAVSVNCHNFNSDISVESNRSPLRQIPHPSMPQFQKKSQLKPQLLGHSQCMNIQSTQPADVHLHTEQEMQKFQHQKFQHSNQKHVQHVWHQRPDHNQQHQQVTAKSDTSGMLSIPPSFVGKQIPEHEIELSNESLLAQANDQSHLSENQNLQEQNTTLQMQDTKGYQASLSEKSHEKYEAPQHALESRNDGIPSGEVLELPQEHRYRQHLEKSHFPKKLSVEQHVLEGFHQRLAVKEEAQQHQISSDAMVSYSLSVMSCGPASSNQERDYLKQRRWLLLLLHARKCSFPKGQCFEVNCFTVQQLWMHMETCNSMQCMFPRCPKSRKLFHHYIACQVVDCLVCIPVHELIASTKARSHTLSVSSVPNLISGSWKNVKNQGVDTLMNKSVPSPCESSDPLRSSKRMKVHHTLATMRESFPGTHHIRKYQPVDERLHSKPDVGEMNMEKISLSGQGNPRTLASKPDYMSNNILLIKPITEYPSPKEFGILSKERTQSFEKEIDQPKMEVKTESKILPSDLTSGSKSCKTKIKGVSLTERFTLQQNMEHIFSLRQWVGQGKTKAGKNQALGLSMNENSCQLCAVEKLTFEPLPIYCTSCGSRIKRNSMYYTTGIGDTRHYFCILCYNVVRGDTIEVEGSSFQKSRFEKKRNDDETEESWVQCDKCEAWQHQICALFNGKRNSGGQAEYTCPYCYIKDIEKGERIPLPQSSVLGAKDLPRTILSDHIEQRLFRRLKQERLERAQYLARSIDEVPGAEALVVRVVSSIDKKLDVKQRFLEIFQEENYPTTFPYKSKVILLFQTIEGVEVCLFGMYVQEFGSECQFPNQRRVYLSYLDSVKYFRPEIKTVNGEALRTFVYHEILIGYLDYCKKRGFTSCYIWACPPLKGEDYILYCHPEIQRTPKSDKLREWYLSMLQKASKEKIIVNHSNLYDMFFMCTGECKAKVTAARLPYFDGDYWPGAAEDIINQHLQEQGGRNHQKKGDTKKPVTKRTYKSSSRTDLASNAYKDALLMEKLGKTISPMKEDFIMVHLQHACTHCCTMMVLGNRWVCSQCKNFQLCDKCYETEQKLVDRDRHPINSRERHVLHSIEITAVSSDTKDNDEIIETEFFDNRLSFLSLCQGNHYQYDTLRRAKHSSMMVLYHLHNPTAPAFVSTCYVCHNDIETSQGWRCEVCPDFDICHICYQKDDGIDHPHKLTSIPSNASCDAQSHEARQKRILQVREMLDLLVHATQCRLPDCRYPNCYKFKALFRHGINCRTRASGGCLPCKKIWCILQLHARACKVAECNVPRCRDLKQHFKRLQQQSDSRRRAAVTEMMRQRAAELDGTDD